MNVESKIKKAAIKLFAEKGFHATTMRQIAELAQINVSLINYHYHSKELLYRYIVQEYTNAEVRQVYESLGMVTDCYHIEDFFGRLRVFSRLMEKSHRANLDLTKIWEREIQAVLTNGKQEQYQFMRNLYEHLTEYYQYGINKQWLQPGLDAKKISHLHISIVIEPFRNMGILQKIIFPESENRAEFITELIQHNLEIFFTGIKNRIA